MTRYNFMQVTPITNVELTYEEARMYCFCCTYNGYKDWRIPTQVEYLSSSNLYPGVWFCELGDDSPDTRRVQLVRGKLND